MRSVMLGKFYASGGLFPELQVSVYTSSNQKVLVLSHSYLRDCVPMHKAFLVHLGTGECSKVRLFMLQNLQMKRKRKM